MEKNRKKARERLLLSAGVYLLVAILGTWLAVRDNLPAGFLGILNGRDPLRDFPLLGTALSAPLILLLVQAGLMVALVRGIKERECTLGLILLGCMYTVGQLGEPIVWQAFVPVIRLQIVVILFNNLLYPIGMVVFGLQSIDRIP